MNELPDPHPSDRPQSHLRLRPELHGHGEHILHLDDETSVTLPVRQMLQKLGYTIASFNCPLEALDHFRADPHRFHLVLTDLMMPEMNGLEFATAVLALRPGLPVVLFTGFGNNCSAAELRRSGIREVLPKPAGVIRIAEALRRELDSLSP